jgi:hypothetical protein
MTKSASQPNAAVLARLKETVGPKGFIEEPSAMEPFLA